MNEQTSARFLTKTGSAIIRAWRDLADAARVRLTGQVRPGLPADDLMRLEEEVAACIEARGGEVAARAIAADIGRVYLNLNDDGRRRFLTMLAERYPVDREAVRSAANAVASAMDDPSFAKASAALRASLEPRSLVLFRRFNGLEEGVKFLVDLRADLIAFARDEPALATLDRHLRGLLESWFDVGFLELVTITWDSQASLLEKLIDYEAVHEIRSWQDLKNRLDSDRRCYGFFHPSMPHEPLIFVEVALVDGMAGNIEELLDEDAPLSDPHRANTAIFYSISNAQAGLAGVRLGDFLIKQVVNDLSQNFPNLKTFATLSPIPGFRRWLDGAVKEEGADILHQAEANAIAEAAGEEDGLAAFLSAADGLGRAEENVVEAAKPALMRLCARYLVKEKRNGRAIDPVGNFHLTNGARVERINWLGDRSAKGLTQSCGLMVNYRYKLSDIEANHERYVNNGTISTSGSVRALL